MRTSCQSLNFWQFDVGLFDDGKIIDLNEVYGPLGEAVYFRILCYIAETDGYFAQLNESLLRYVFRSIGSKWIKKAKITEIIQYCGVCGLFDVNLLTQNVITSQGIQRRWLYAKKKSRARGFLTDRFWLLDGSGLSDYTLNSDNCDNNTDYCNNKDDNCDNNSSISQDNTRQGFSNAREACCNNSNNGTSKKHQGSFETDDFFEAAVKRALGDN